MIFFTALSLPILFFGSCMMSKTDSKRVAMEANKGKFDKKLRHDIWFAVSATDAGMREVRLGELAKTSSTSDNVKQFGEKVTSEHSKANDELKRIAVDKKIALPDKLSDKSQKKYDKISKKTGSDFDKAYMKCVVKNHKIDAKTFNMESKKGKDPEIKKFAGDKLSMLESHLEQARNTCKDIKKKK